MRTIEITDSISDLPQLLNEVRDGIEITLTCNQEPIARLVPIMKLQQVRRRVGDIRGPVFHVPDTSFAALSEAKLKEWGL